MQVFRVLQSGTRQRVLNRLAYLGDMCFAPTVSESFCVHVTSCMPVWAHLPI
jgi:hypothetical protein